MTCLKELIRYVLVDALTYHQKVVVHLLLSSIYLLEVKGEHQVLICQDVVNHCHFDRNHF